MQERIRVADIEGHNGSDAQPPQPKALQRAMQPIGDMATANERYFGGDDIDLKSEFDPDLALILAEAENLAAYWESAELSFFLEHIARKRVSLKRRGRGEWVRSWTNAQEIEGRMKENGRV